MERTTLEIIAPSVEEALARGLEQLGVSKEMVDVDVLDEGTRGFLGLGSRQVRVRLSLKSADAPSPASLQADAAAAPTDGDALLAYAERVTSEMLGHMKVAAKVSARYAANPDSDGDLPMLVDIHGDDLSVLIGRRAETLNALQYLLALIISKEATHWIQVIVDVEGYRARRERQLRQLARRMADQVIRTGKRQMLEPMSAAERRIVHLELRDHAEVKT
ncbi:MAG: RNA-binding cell elongation regulator Jag/EloR, partial [Anaerolineales bacterium]